MQNNADYAIFTAEMKKEYTILVPNMLPVHFGLILKIMENYGYHIELLQTEGRNIVEQGLKNTHNDTCYPALLVIGQLLDALLSGAYDTNKVALLMSQTGGGCRASNYIHLLRKALQKNGLGHIPVISLNASGLEEHTGFKLTVPMMEQLAYSVLLGDLMMYVSNQCKPYEVIAGSTQKAIEICMEQICTRFSSNRLVGYGEVKRLCHFVLNTFAYVQRDTSVAKKRVGIVGEIYVKFSPLGNNHLEDFLLEENCEPVMAGLMDFLLYCVYNTVIDHRLYLRNYWKATRNQALYHYLLSKQDDLITTIEKHGVFRAPMHFDQVRKLSHAIIGEGVKMGEGWLLPAEMVGLVCEGAPNIVCAQPFGCLPNHIVGKGMVRKICDLYPEANIVSIDYDPGASRINQENRIKLMLAQAKDPNDVEPPARAVYATV